MNGQTKMSPLSDSMVIVTLLLASGCYVCCKENLTAFEWLTLDMGPFWERQINPNFLRNDFFTNASSDVNPRHFLGHFVLLLVRLLDVSWYEVVYFLKLFFLILFPPVLYKALANCTLFLTNKTQMEIAPKLILALGCGVLLHHQWLLLPLSIATWRMIIFQMIPSTASFFLSLIAFCAIGEKRLGFASARFLLWFLAVLFHPTVALFSFTFYSLILFYHQYIHKKFSRKYVLVWIREGVAFLFGLGVIFVFYRDGSASISTKEFIETYVLLGHPHHYDIYRFARTMIKYNWWDTGGIAALCFLCLALVLKNFSCGKKYYIPQIFLFLSGIAIFCQWFYFYNLSFKSIATIGPAWWDSIGIISICFLCLSLILKKSGGKIFWLPLILLVVIFIAVFCQWFFIHIVPLKLMAVLGPVRYTFLSYYQILLCLSLAFVHIKLPEIKMRVRFPLSVTYTFSGLIVLAIFWIGLARIDDPKQRIYGKNALFWSWLQNTAEGAVFAVPFSTLSQHLGLVGNRAVFVNSGFPFSEKNFKDFHERFVSLYGNPKIVRTNIHYYWNKFYNSLTMKHFLCLSQKFRLDYVIRRKSEPFSEQYSFMTVFLGNSYVVYDLNKYDGEYSCNRQDSKV